MNAWKVVNFLKQVHLDQHIRVDTEVSPIHIPVACFITGLHLPVELVGYLSYNRVLRHYVNATST